MAALSSANTIAEIEAALMDNASFEEDGSLTKALAVITAGNLWLIKRPVSTSRDGDSITLNVHAVQALIDQARAFASAHPGGSSGGVKFLGIGEGFR